MESFNFDWANINLSGIINNDNMSSQSLPKKILTNEEKKWVKNQEKAFELIPESLFGVDMIYIPCSVNGEYVNAFIDSGAQSSSINIETATRCGLGDVINTDAITKLVGVGSHDSLGKIYYAEVTIGGSIVPTSFTVTHNGPDVLIGLRTLKCHKCVLDFGKNVLHIGKDSIPFLKDSEINDIFYNNLRNTNKEQEDID